MKCFSFVLFCCFWKVAFSETRRSSDDSTAGHLFSAGTHALSWDSDELNRVRALHKRTFNDPEAYQKHNNLALYLGLTPISGIHLPVPVNILLIGFHRDGNKKIEIRPEELKDWFETMQHIAPHVRIPHTELGCKEDGHCIYSPMSQTPHPLHSYVHYNISVHAVEVESSLSRQFTQLLKGLSRPLFYGHEDPRRQVDVVALEAVIDGMLAEFGLLWNYNILLVNPEKIAEQGYVYRPGLSELEIKALSEDRRQLNRLKREAIGLSRKMPVIPGSDLIGRAWHPSRPSQKFDIQRVLYESTKWSNGIKQWLIDRKKLVDHVSPDLKDYKELLTVKGIHPDMDFAQLLDSIGYDEDRTGLEAFGGLRVMEPEEGCSVDMWIGHHRWMMLDFASLGQDWGPFHGGDGLKTSHSLPSIDYHFSLKTSLEDLSLKYKLMQEKQQRVMDLKTFNVEEREEIPLEVLREMEFEIFSKFYTEHCTNRMVEPLPTICKKLELALGKLEDGKQVFTTEEGTDLLEDWLKDEEQSLKGFQPEARLKDLFLAHLSAILSRGIHHVFLPPTLTWKQGESSSMAEHSKPFARTVNFRVLILMDPHDRMDPTHAFDIGAFKKELMSLKMENQNFHFIFQKKNILEDHIISTSLASSLRSTTLEILGSDMSMKSEERIYLDTKELQTMLSKHYSKIHRTLPVDQHGELEIPIFIFSLDRAMPVFLDQHSLAKALDNMVIVVQNTQHRGQHPIGLTCGGFITGQTLSAPLKAAISATLQFLGGLVPPHLGYNPSRQSIIHDWMWSIGANPFSLTSPGWKISQGQKDAFHRTYLLDAMDLSVEQINYGISLLEEVTPSDRSFDMIQKESSLLVLLLQRYSEIVDLWRQVVSELNQMEFHKASQKIPAIEMATIQFVSLAETLNAGLQPLACQPASTKIFGIGWLTQELIGVLLVVGVVIGLFKVLPKKRKKKPF